MPQKNIVPFMGQPLIVHSIQYALTATGVDEVFVSTDDEDISAISQSAGASVIPRPSSLSGDTATTESAIEHAVQWWHEHKMSPDTIVLLQATSPLRPSGSLDIALNKFWDGNFDSLLSISPTHRFFWEISGDQAKAQYDFMNRPRRQDMTAEDIRYVENGSIYIFTHEHFSRTGNRLGGAIGYTIFPEAYSPEIDTPSDFMLLENIASKLDN